MRRPFIFTSLGVVRGESKRGNRKCGPENTGSVGLSLVVWFCAGLINLCLALCFTEMATMMPKAGGPYAYLMHVFGPLPGFLLAWGYLLLIAGPFWAYNAYTAVIYITQPFYQDCDPPETATKLLAAWIIGMFFIFCS